MRDLLGVDLHPADDFPQDDSGYGFDNIGDVLSLSPVLMEKYLVAAEKVARTALFGPEQLKPTLLRLRVQGRRIDPATIPQSDYDLTGLSLPNAIHVAHRFPVDGEYIIRVFWAVFARPVPSRFSSDCGSTASKLKQLLSIRKGLRHSPMTDKTSPA